MVYISVIITHITNNNLSLFIAYQPYARVPNCQDLNLELSEYQADAQSIELSRLGHKVEDDLTKQPNYDTIIPEEKEVLDLQNLSRTGLAAL